MLDIDHFKHINDTYGHLAGDMVLKKVAHLIKDKGRVTDMSGRYGGEEFLILFRNTDSQNAYELAEKIRAGIEQKQLIYQKHNIKVTISIGVAAIDTNMKSSNDWIQHADTAMYLSKQKGRNQTTIYKGPDK